MRISKMKKEITEKISAEKVLFEKILAGKSPAKSGGSRRLPTQGLYAPPVKSGGSKKTADAETIGTPAKSGGSKKTADAETIEHSGQDPAVRGKTAKQGAMPDPEEGLDSFPFVKPIFEKRFSQIPTEIAESVYYLDRDALTPAQCGQIYNDMLRRYEPTEKPTRQPWARSCYNPNRKKLPTIEEIEMVRIMNQGVVPEPCDKLFSQVEHGRKWIERRKAAMLTGSLPPPKKKQKRQIAGAQGSPNKARKNSTKSQSGSNPRPKDQPGVDDEK